MDTGETGSRPPVEARPSGSSTIAQPPSASASTSTSHPPPQPQQPDPNATPTPLPFPETQASPPPKRPSANRTITNDRLSIEAFVARKAKFRRSWLGKKILGDKAEKEVREARQGQPKKGGLEPTEDEVGEYQRDASGSPVDERGEAVHMTQHWLERHDIPIGEAAPEEGGRGHKREGSSKWAWDVLYENQFGIYIFGRPHFSSGLIPFGSPTAFTLTAAPGSHAADITVSGLLGTSGPVPIKIIPPTASAPAGTERMSDRDWRKAQYLTGYTLKTKPLPSPEWEAVTPWMINMTAGTDENGWRYNWRWRSRGWKSHAGTLGWGGWCRRREWLKLIHFSKADEGSEASPIEAKAPPWATKTEEEEHRQKELEAEQKLKRIVKHHTPEENLHALLKALGKVPLDRRKLELWDEWLGHAEVEEREKLLEVLLLPDALEDLRFAFTFSASFTDFLALLQKHNFELKLLESPSTAGSPQLPSGPPGVPARPYTLTGP